VRRCDVEAGEGLTSTQATRFHALCVRAADTLGDHVVACDVRRGNPWRALQALPRHEPEPRLWWCLWALKTVQVGACSRKRAGELLDRVDAVLADLHAASNPSSTANSYCHTHLHALPSGPRVERQT